MPPIAAPVLAEWQARTASFDRLGAHAQARLNFRSSPSKLGEPIWVEIAGAGFFDTVGITALRGRRVTRPPSARSSS